MIFLIPILLAFAYRSRGGAIPLGSDTLARVLFWVLPIGLVSGYVCHFQHLPLWLALPCAVMAYAGATIPHAAEQGNTPQQYEGMGYITEAMLILILLPFYLYLASTNAGWEVWRHFLYAFPFGLLGGVGYWLGYKMKYTLRFFGVTWCVPGDSSWGELIGSFLAFSVPLAILGLI